MYHRLKKLLKFTVPLLFVGSALAAVQFWPESPANVVASGEWTCSMHPQIRLPAPGQCPICRMNLIPVAQLSEKGEIEKRAGIETEQIKYLPLFKDIRTVGKLDYNETRVAHIATRIDGRVDRVYADFTGMQVKKGDHLVELYSPKLNVAQSELLSSLQALKNARPDSRRSAQTSVESVREKLRLLGILPEQVEEIERTKKTSDHLVIYAPIGGTVIEKNIREGQYVSLGDTLYRIADFDPIWLYLDIYEYDLAWVQYGQNVEVTVEAYPGEVFQGTVTFIDPFLNDETRTVRVRVNLQNPGRRLKPAMYASAVIRVGLRSDGAPEPTGLEGKYICPMHPEVVREEPGDCPICGMRLEQVPGEPLRNRSLTSDQTVTQDGASDEDRGQHPHAEHVLAVPITAVLDTGKRKVAYRQDENGAYQLIELQLGPRAEARVGAGRNAAFYPVLGGLAAGDRIVVRGAFLLDSQRQIEGMPSLLYPDGQSVANLHSGHGGPAENTSSKAAGHQQ